MARSLQDLGALVAAVAVCFGCQAEKADERPPDPRPTTAVIVTAKQDADHAVADTATEALEALAAQATGVDLLAGSRLHRRLGKDPKAVIRACGSDLGCIAKLGRKLGVPEVVFGRVIPVEHGVRMQFLTLKTATEKIERPVQLDLDSLAALRPTLRERFEAIVGVPVAVTRVAAEIDTAQEQGPGVAVCAQVHGSAELRPASTLRWKPLRSGQKLFAGDVVKTHSAATAQIEYRSGATFQVTPASVVVIEGMTPSPSNQEATPEISVRSGTIRGVVQEGEGRLRVRAPDGEQVDLAPAAGSGKLEYRLGTRRGGTLEVAVNKGKGVLSSNRGSTATLAAGQAQDIRDADLGGKIVALPDFPKLLGPGVDATVMFAPGLELALSWRQRPSDAGYHLQVAEDPSFSRLTYDQLTTTAKAFVRPRRIGTYYWRVATRTTDEREGEFGFVRRLYVTPEKSLDLLVSPDDGAEVRFPANAPRFIKFSWRATVPPAPYTLVVARDEQLEQDVALSLVTKSQELQTRQLPPGDYFWGVFVERGTHRVPIFKQARRLSIY